MNETTVCTFEMVDKVFEQNKKFVEKNDLRAIKLQEIKTQMERITLLYESVLKKQIKLIKAYEKINQIFSKLVGDEE